MAIVSGSDDVCHDDVGVGQNLTGSVANVSSVRHYTVMQQEYREAFRFQTGNALGIVFEPIRQDGKRVPKSEWEVRIGPADWDLAMKESFPSSDFEAVVRTLREWCVGGDMRKSRSS